jgi:serine/threonine protein kinase
MNGSTSNLSGTSRWMAPELLNAEADLSSSNARSTASDVYALAMTAIEVIVWMLMRAIQT